MWKAIEGGLQMIRRKPGYRRRLDLASVALAMTGVLSGTFAYWLISAHEANALVLVPSVVAATLGATHLTKVEAPRV